MKVLKAWSFGFYRCKSLHRRLANPRANISTAVRRVIVTAFDQGVENNPKLLSIQSHHHHLLLALPSASRLLLLAIATSNSSSPHDADQANDSIFPSLWVSLVCICLDHSSCLGKRPDDLWPPSQREETCGRMRLCQQPV